MVGCFVVLVCEVGVMVAEIFVRFEMLVVADDFLVGELVFRCVNVECWYLRCILLQF